MLLIPGTVVGVIPFLLSRWRIQPALLGFVGVRWIGAAMLLLAAPLFADFVVRFVREGRGTPAPIAPTQRLVVGGPFRYTRNPGYIGVIGLLVGQGLVFGSPAVLLYAGCVTIAFHLFVLLYEEPTLRRQFGRQYIEYCQRVPRWIPSRRGRG